MNSSHAHHRRVGYVEPRYRGREWGRGQHQVFALQGSRAFCTPNGLTAKYEHLVAGHDIDWQHLEPIADVVLVDADLISGVADKSFV